MPINDIGNGSSGSFSHKDIKETKANPLGLQRFESLIFPKDLSPGNFYPEAMKFTIKKRLGVSLKDLGDAVADVGEQTQIELARKAQQKKLPQGVDPLIPANQLNELERADLIAESDLTGLDAGIAAARGTTTAIGNARTRARTNNLEIKRNKEDVVGSIYLNMPQSIQNDDNIAWAGRTFGTLGALTQNATGLGQNEGTLGGALVGNAGAIAGGTLGGMIGFLADKLRIPAGLGLGTLAGAVAGGGPIQNVIEGTLGLTTNPYEEMMFSGITFRSFNFDFIFRPRTVDEIKKVDHIIRAFRRYSRPSFVGGSLGNSVMQYPHEFQIEFLTSDTEQLDQEAYAENEHLPRIKPCVCERVSTNYTPNGVWAAYKSGSPVAITMSLGFKEKELVMQDDISDGEFERQSFQSVENDGSGF